MTEVPATVESEFVPEPKPYSDRIIQWMSRTGNEEAYIHRDEIEGMCKRQGGRYRILRVSPPVERRVSIDWAAAKKELGSGYEYLGNTRIARVIQRHARIVEVPKP